jgi:hypothetical protein
LLALCRRRYTDPEYNEEDEDTFADDALHATVPSEAERIQFEMDAMTR